MKRTLLALAFLSLASEAWPQAQRASVGEWQPVALYGQEETSHGGGEKSVVLAAGLSLLLPGMGELYADNFSTGKYFLIADGALWLTYAGLSMSSGWVQDDADVYLTQHAAALLSGKGDQFRVDVGNYMSVYEYNEAKLRERDYSRLYDPVQNYWSWDTDPNRNQYRDLRISSDQLERNATFVLGALVVNRLISAFVAGRSAAAYNDRLQESRSWKLGARVVGGPLNAQGIELKLTVLF